MIEAKWASIAIRLFESYYVAAQLEARRLLLASAEVYRKLADRRAAHLLAVALEFPNTYSPNSLGRDL
jgi:hypothetical protein